MARKPAGGKTRGGSKKRGEIEEDTEVVETTLLFPESTIVQALAKAKLKLQKSNSSAGGEFGEKVGKAVEEKHLDRKAFSIACQFNKMFDTDPLKMATAYFHLLRYLGDLDIPNKAKEHQGMFEAEETGPGLKGKAAAKDEDAEVGNVTHIGSAARKVAERAGEQA